MPRLTPIQTLGIVGLKSQTLCNNKKLDLHLRGGLCPPLFFIININVMIIKRKELVLLNVNYYLPDYKNIIQEFVWQTKDVTPELPRVHKFLNFWHHNIEAVISEVFVTYGNEHEVRVTDFIKELG